MTIREEICGIIKKTTPDVNNFQILEPEIEDFGDYSTNLAFLLSKKEKKAPQEVAKHIKAELEKNKDIFEKIEIASGGFINLFLTKKYLQEKLEEIEDNYGKIEQGKKEKIQVELISANPTGPLHLGHGRNAFYGDVLANVLEYAGHEVEREYYVNDAKESTQIRELGKTVLGKGEQYNSEYLDKKKEELKNEIKNLDNEGEIGYFVAHEILTDIKKLVDKLGIKFDNWFSESILYENDKREKLLEDFKKKDLIYKEDGAMWLKTSKFGDEKDRVIIRKTGDATYFLSDILYHQDKIKRGFDKIINIWGSDHQGHEKRMQALMKALEYRGELVIPIIQMMRLQTKEGSQKMSKRAGTVVNLEWLIDEVGKDVVRFMMISKDISTQMTFDLELAKEKSEKNPVFYLQYALVRCKSILRNAKLSQITPNLSLLKEKEELSLIKQLIKFPDLIKDVSRNYEIHHLTTYGMNLAKKLHQFYKKCRVIDEKDQDLTDVRLKLIEATEIVFEQLFDILGIQKLEEM